MRVRCRLYVRASVSTTSLPAIEGWLFQALEDPSDSLSVLPVHCFGDLDRAGMQILAILREVFSPPGPPLGVRHTGNSRACWRQAEDTHRNWRQKLS